MVTETGTDGVSEGPEFSNNVLHSQRTAGHNYGTWHLLILLPECHTFALR